MTKRIISIVTAIMLMLQIMMVCPIELSAETPPQTTTYTGTGYTVEYTVKSSWDKTQNIGIKLNNTSDSPMSVWALKYNAHGEIRELYNGEVYKNEGTEYIIRSTSSNSSIEAGKSVEFGYSVTGENLSVPESIVLCSEQREANEAEYSVEFQLSEQWNPTYTAKIVLNNLSQFEMTGWSLSYDSNATVENIWNGKLISQNNGRITVSGSAENFTLPTGGTTEININGKVSYETPAAENFKLTYTYINADIEADNNGEEKEDLVIFAFGNYDEETDNLEVSWYSNTEKGTYEVLKSTDNITYTAIASVTDTDSCSVAGTSLNNGTQYFKVKVTDESGRTAESIPFEVTKNENGVTSEYIDTDNDGLADYLEETLGTDPDKADTDNDELTDYEEIYITGTDPLKADTDGNGRLDSKEDPDNDGLNNIQEIGLKTDPLNPDTDGDGLTDGDEYNIYWTLPTKYDTDDDGIGDGDEIKIGLNPKNPKTYGMPDTEYTIPQEVTADSEAMSEINTEDNPYELSVEVKAAGNAENISVSESGYANAMHNDAILGIIPELSYDSNCKVDEVVVKFKLEDEALTEKTELPELKGIQRYQIFKFFEDDNMLLPIITEYNEATNTISATTDCMGTYCVMDMGNFLSSIAAIENEEVAEEPTELTPMLMSLNAEAPKLTVKPQDEFNVVFAVDTRFAGTPTWETILESISGSAEEIFKRSPNVIIYLLEQNMPSATGDSVEEVGTYTNYDELTVAFEEYKNKESVINPLNQCDMSEAIDYVNKNIGETLPTFMFSFLEPQGAKYNKQKRDETINGINPTTDICLVLNNVTPSDTSFGSAAINNKVENVFKSYDSKDDIVNHIYDEKQVQTTYTIINSCGLKDVELKAPLTYKCFQAARGITTDYSGLADTDNDGLFDFQEIDCLSTLFTVDDYGKVFKYPNYADCMINRNGKEFYVDIGLEKYKEELKKGENQYAPQSYLDYLLYTTKVLPINSDPTKKDGDYDLIEDNYDITPLNNVFSGELYTVPVDGYHYTCDASFAIDYRRFFENNECYHKDLSILGSIMATIAYHTSKLTLTQGANASGDITMLYDVLKFDYRNYILAANPKYDSYYEAYRDDDISEMTIGHKVVEYNDVQKELIFVTVRGTDATIEEWSSNFDVGADTEDYWDRDNPHWKNKMNHKGFDTTANRVLEIMNKYINDNVDPDLERIIYIVGHSRGAAISNILGTHYENLPNYDSFVYAFATPNTTMNTKEECKKYKTIFNIVNEDDMVPQLPLSEEFGWGFNKYGTIYSLSIRDSYEYPSGGGLSDSWEAMFKTNDGLNHKDYNFNGNLDKTLDEFGKIANSREDLYKYTNDSDTIYTYHTNLELSDAKDKCEKIIGKYGDRISRHCQVYIEPNDIHYIDGNIVEGYDVKIKQSPAFLTMALTDVIAKKCYKQNEFGEYIIGDYDMRGKREDKYLGQDVGFAMALKYKSARNEFCKSGADSASWMASVIRFGGMVNPHMPATYYLIAVDKRNKLKKVE